MGKDIRSPVLGIEGFRLFASVQTPFQESIEESILAIIDVKWPLLTLSSDIPGFWPE